MKKLLILGAGTAGTMMTKKIKRKLAKDWSITVIDEDNIHDCQPGSLFVPFDINTPERRSGGQNGNISPPVLIS